MHPELLRIPLAGGLSIKSYGTFMVIGFLAAVWVLRHLAARQRISPILINNAALYALIAGVIGARLFYVVHYWRDFAGDWLGIFKIWRGGLEFLGGVLLAIGVLLVCLRRWRLPVAKVLDIFAIGLMVGLGFGRIGCFMNGCCFGRPAYLPWAVRFPYNSFAFISQINPNPRRNRPHPQLDLPMQEYLDYVDKDGIWYPKPLDALTSQQRYEVTKGRYRALPVHPTQIYESIAAFAIAGLLYLFWSRTRHEKARWPFLSGMTFPLMFVSYGLARFLLEYLRDDNPYEWARLTISQILGLVLIVVGCSIWVWRYAKSVSR